MNLYQPMFGKRDWETLSEIIWKAQRRWWPVRILVAGSCILLFTHLVFEIP